MTSRHSLAPSNTDEAPTQYTLGQWGNLGTQIPIPRNIFKLTPHTHTHTHMPMANANPNQKLALAASKTRTKPNQSRTKRITKNAKTITKTKAEQEQTKPKRSSSIGSSIGIVRMKMPQLGGKVYNKFACHTHFYE